MQLAVHDSLADIDGESWNTLAGDSSPFLDWEWLRSLEESGCASRESGWRPQHLIFKEGSRLIAACPLYVKSHSQGEFVFDHAWAEAAQRAGLRYYPKLLAAVPFTPAAGRRFLIAPELDRATTVAKLADLLREVCVRSRFSSVHVNFCAEDEIEALETRGFLHREGYQFQWRNRGWRDFDDYLGSFRSKRRVQIKRERRELHDQGIEVEAIAGDAIDDSLIGTMFEIYKSTLDKLYWGRQYLNRAFFELLRQRWRHRLVFFIARRQGRIVAGTFTVRHRDVLYGRYWGCFEEHRYLHFNLCYYASIEYCLGHGIDRFEPGAGGEFKFLRGFDPYPTHSLHYFTEPRFGAAVADFLARERDAVHGDLNWMREHSALKPTSNPEADA